MSEVNRWVEAGNSCLKAAIKILDAERSSERPDPALTASACQLIHAAVEIDELNLDWQKSQSSFLVPRGRPVVPLGEGN